MRVDELQRLKADGFDPQPPREFHGAWTFYFRCPGGFVVEVLHQLSGGGGLSDIGNMAVDFQYNFRYPE